MSDRDDYEDLGAADDDEVLDQDEDFDENYEDEEAVEENDEDDEENMHGRGLYSEGEEEEDALMGDGTFAGSAALPDEEQRREAAQFDALRDSRSTTREDGFAVMNAEATAGGMATVASASTAAAPGQPSVTRITTRYLTKYERARLLGTRALQLRQNAPPAVELRGETDALQIAQRELKERKLPMIVRRYLPDGSYEDWTLDELIID